jgi:hypothetical protein
MKFELIRGRNSNRLAINGTIVTAGITDADVTELRDTCNAYLAERMAETAIPYAVIVKPGDLDGVPYKTEAHGGLMSDASRAELAPVCSSCGQRGGPYCEPHPTTTCS